MIEREGGNWKVGFQVGVHTQTKSPALKNRILKKKNNFLSLEVEKCLKIHFAE